MEHLTQRLQAFEEWQLISFGVCVAERLYPNYALFSRLTEFGDAEVLRRALDRVWERLANRSGKFNAETQLEKLEQVTPDPENFDMYGVYPALDAALAVSATLNLYLQASAEEAGSISSLSEETVADFLELSADPDLSDEELVRFIATHPLMEQEVAFQEAVVEQLEAASAPAAELIDGLRELARNEGVSNIGIADEA